jgi:2-oxoglutarate ferredoxin oxidoreductase subunit beta
MSTATCNKYGKTNSKDFATDQSYPLVPGGDYSILAQVQRIMPELGVPFEQIVFISGISCSIVSHYMNTYGFHTIHGRTGDCYWVEGLPPELMVWVVTGDGTVSVLVETDARLRRNVDLKSSSSTTRSMV